MGLARKVAHQSVASANIDYEDAYGLAVVGLTKAVERFNPSENDFFSSFAMPYIRGEIQHYMRDKGSTVRLHRKYQDYATKLNQIIRRYERKGINPNRNLLRQELGISEEILSELEIAILNRNNQLKLDMRIPGSEDLTLGEAIAAKESLSLASIDKAWSEIENAIAKINPPLARRALEIIYLNNESLGNASVILGVSITEVKQLLNHAIEVLAKEVNLNFSEVCGLVANFGDEADIKSIWNLAETCLDDFSKERFYESLAA